MRFHMSFCRLCLFGTPIEVTWAIAFSWVRTYQDGLPFALSFIVMKFVFETFFLTECSVFATKKHFLQSAHNIFQFFAVVCFFRIFFLICVTQAIFFTKPSLRFPQGVFPYKLSRDAVWSYYPSMQSFDSPDQSRKSCPCSRLCSDCIRKNVRLPIPSPFQSSAGTRF